MDRRSRSASRHNPHNHYNSNGMSSLQADYGNHYRHSTHFDNNGAPASMTNGLLLRPGGDSRTLSPDRRNNNESGGGAGYPMRGGSYNQYTMHRPAQPLTSLSHITGGGMGPPPPRPPTSSPPKSAPAPQTSPPPVPNGQPPPSSSSSGQPASVKYADEYSLSLKKASESTGPYANGRVGRGKTGAPRRVVTCPNALPTPRGKISRITFRFGTAVCSWVHCEGINSV